jgi:nitrate/nitrite transporter NarK
MLDASDWDLKSRLSRPQQALATSSSARFTTLLLGGAILAQQVITYAAASAFYPDDVRGPGLGAAAAAGRVGSLAGPLFSAALRARGRNATEVLLDTLPIVLACGACVGLALPTARAKVSNSEERDARSAPTWASVGKNSQV